MGLLDVYTDSLERKRSFLNSLPLTDVFDIDFPLSFPHLLTCRSISLLVKIGKDDKDFPQISTAPTEVSIGNGASIFCKSSFEELVVFMTS